MALEHNLIYFSTRAKSDNSHRINTAAPATSIVVSEQRTTIEDLRDKADELGLSLSILLKRIQDPDKRSSYISDSIYGYSGMPSTSKRSTSNILEIKSWARQAGIKTPLIIKNYYTTIYSSYIRKVDEVDAMMAEAVTGVVDV